MLQRASSFRSSLKKNAEVKKQRRVSISEHLEVHTYIHESQYIGLYKNIIKIQNLARALPKEYHFFIPYEIDRRVNIIDELLGKKLFEHACQVSCDMLKQIAYYKHYEYSMKFNPYREIINRTSKLIYYIHENPVNLPDYKINTIISTLEFARDSLLDIEQLNNQQIKIFISKIKNCYLTYHKAINNNKAIVKPSNASLG